MDVFSKVNFENEILFYIRRIHNLLITRINSEIKETGLTVSQFEILSYLAVNEIDNHSVTQKQIEDFFGLSHPAVIRLLKQLQGKGFVEVSVNSEDKRHRNVHLTEQARLFGQRFISKIGIPEDIMSVLLTPEQQETLKSILEVMYKGLREKILKQ